MTATATSSTPAAAVDLCAQALKALSERCPFDTEEFASRVPTLPFGVAAHIPRHSDGRRKFKKSSSLSAAHGEQAPNAGGQGAKQSKGSSFWDEMEVYFRPITEADIEGLRPRGLDDSCFLIPALEGSFLEADKDAIFSGNEVGVSSEAVKEVEEKSDKGEGGVTIAEVEQEQQEPMEIDSVGNFNAAADTGTLPIQEVAAEEEEEDEGSSMSWVLGSKHRAILTTQRPTKKRKLLGNDAGLDQLLALPHFEEGTIRCDVCCLGEGDGNSNKIVSCSLCNVLVHKKCYGLHGAVEGQRLCSWCKHLEGMLDDEIREQTSSMPCLLCPKKGGALKPVGGDHKYDTEKKFAHLFCSLWTPEVYVEDTGRMEPIVNIEGVPEMRTRLVCNVCKVKHGVCVRCSFGTCRTAYHPICAREARHQMEIWGKFGCDNIELRAFCSKHSYSGGADSAQCTRNLSRNVGDEFSVAKPPLPNKLPKLLLSLKNKEKNTTSAQVTSSVSNEVDKNEANIEQDVMTVKLSPDAGDMKSSKNIDSGDIERDDSLPELIPLVKKLIGRGKIVVDDIASQIGISSDSLEVALMGEISSFPAELRLKISKWFQEYIYIPADKRHLKFRNGSAISARSLAARVDCPNATDVTGLDVPDCIKIADADDTGACSVKSLSCKIAKDNTRVLENDNAVYLSGEQCQQNSKGELVDDIRQDLVVPCNDNKEDTVGNISSIHDQSRVNDHVLMKMMTADVCASANLSPLVLPPEIEGNSATVEKNEFCETQHQPDCTVENNLSKKLDNGQVAQVDSPQNDDVQKERTGGSCSGSYVHPFIQKRLLQAQKGVLSKHENRESNGHNEERMLSTKASGSCNLYMPSPICAHVDQILDPRQLHQLAKAKQMGLLDSSLEDEVEGEMLYLQNKLIDNAFSIKHSFEDLLGRVVKKLPQELDALKKQRWDSALVNHFLREVREVKKRGRKERRHREAQAVLAAAAAVASASSRNPLLRKDGSDEIGSPHSESLQMVSTPGRAAGQPSLGPRLKETPKSALVKVSPDKHSSILQFQESSKENGLVCDICRRSETLLNRIFVCSSCKVAVHLDCYRKLKDPIGPWKCELCEEISVSGSPRNQRVESRERSYCGAECGLCGGTIGAFRKATNGQWVHAFCAEWLLEPTFRRGQQNLVDGVDVISKEKDLVTCCVCQQKFGVCSRCSYGHCQAAFHPFCARAAGFYMNIKTIGGRFHHKAYCERHSVEQRQKADSQQCGAEELKNIKQIRFELEKVRILCERIVKREKIKRDLVLCSHDILASRRDYVAYSVHVRSSFYPPGVSSESATTSIDNKSYSGTIQRSEDITVDSTVSGKRSIRLSLDMDRKTDDSSTSQPSFKRKLADRTSYSGKQLPHRTQSISFRNSADDGNRRFKARKHTETFHKEVVMTSHQASMQNQRLPKGFAYVPIDHLSQEKPVIHDSHEPEEPGG